MRVGNELVDLAVEAAILISRGQEEVYELVAQRTVGLFAAAAGVGFVRWAMDDAGEVEVRLSVGGVPPMDDAWLERAKEIAPRTPSIQAFAAFGVHEPLRMSDVLDLPRFWGTDEFEHIHGVHQGRYPLGAAVIYRPDELAFIGMHRIKRDFSDDDVANLRQLQGVLTRALAFRRTLDDAVRDMRRQEPRRAAVVPWLRDMMEHYTPTPREAEVLALVVDGWTNRQIATRLGITERTVRKHLSAVYEQADVRGRAAAAAWWRERGSREV